MTTTTKKPIPQPSAAVLEFLRPRQRPKQPPIDDDATDAQLEAERAAVLELRERVPQARLAEYDAAASHYLRMCGASSPDEDELVRLAEGLADMVDDDGPETAAAATTRRDKSMGIAETVSLTRQYMDAHPDLDDAVRVTKGLTVGDLREHPEWWSYV